MRQSLSFYLGDTLCVLQDIAPTLTLLDWLRQQGRTGTKEGCNEGDCGACTVIVARLRQGAVSICAVNACIQLVAMLDGACVFTIEDIGAPGALHPVQQAMVARNGSQCGFCTPGFVMSMVAYRQLDRARPKDTQANDTRSNDAAIDAESDAEIDAALAGNLCRCTGYAPIVQAMKDALAAPDSGFEARISGLADRLESLAHCEDIQIQTASGILSVPARAASLAAMLEAYPDTTIVAGATDVGLWVTKAMRDFARVAFIGQCADLQTLTLDDDGLTLGAAVTYGEAKSAFEAVLPDFGRLIGRIGSTQIRNSATVCGNIANGSPIGDGPPALIAAGAHVHLRCGQARRVLDLEDFFLGYGRQDRRTGEFVEALCVPHLPVGTLYRVYKISKRFDQDISAVFGAFAVRCDENGQVMHVRLAFGGMAATPCRARHAESALLGRVWGDEAIEAAREALAQDFSPLDDMRASAWYRLTVAGNLLLRFYEEVAGMERRLVRAGGCAHV